MSGWNWDQGRLAYFQFDAVQQISRFVVGNDFVKARREELLDSTGLQFRAPETHSPWRNYSRVLKLLLLVSEFNGNAQATPVAQVLSSPGTVTCDEYFHFLVCAFSSPSPALSSWAHGAQLRYPLLFSLKYLLAKASAGDEPRASIEEIVGAYSATGFTGGEDDNAFIDAIQQKSRNESAATGIPRSMRRQSAESLRVISQISYLHFKGRDLSVSLDRADAQAIFSDLMPVGGAAEPNREDELRRRASLFQDGSTNIEFDYPNTIVGDVIESGFREGNKAKKTHVTIERNSTLRREFFALRPTSICDVCALDTARTYPWTHRVLDIHHLLPLSSGTRVESDGTTFDDLVPLCPSCHRAVHRYYDRWLEERGRMDFWDRREAKQAYGSAKSDFPGLSVSA